jgi:nicotinamidase-related amidase
MAVPSPHLAVRIIADSKMPFPNLARLAAHCRSRGIPVIHVWFVRRADARDMTLNAPLFEGCVDANAMIEGTWVLNPCKGLKRSPVITLSARRA